MSCEELTQSQKEALEFCRVNNGDKPLPSTIYEKYKVFDGKSYLLNFPRFLNDNPEIKPFLCDLYLPMCTFGSTEFKNLKFENCVLNNSLFYCFNLKDLSFYHCNLTRAFFNHVNFSNTTTFLNCDLRRAAFDANTYAGADFKKVFYDSTLTGAQFNALDDSDNLILTVEQQRFLIAAEAWIDLNTECRRTFYLNLLTQWENEKTQYGQDQEEAKNVFLLKRNICPELFDLDNDGSLVRSTVAVFKS